MSSQAHVGTGFIAIRTAEAETVCFFQLLQYHDSLCVCNGTTGYFQGRVSMQKKVFTVVTQGSGNIDFLSRSRSC